MQRQTAYTNLADWFEYLNDDCGYEKWSQYLISKLGEFPLKKGLDVGCGSGRFTRELMKIGYEMTGLDISEEMLNKAVQISLKEGRKIPFLLGDIARFKTPEKYDFVTAINDCINYLPKEKLRLAFKNVAAALHKNGIFFFDISSERKEREKIANTVCADDRDDVTYLSFNSLNGDVVTMDVTLFVRRKDGAFDRFDERHVQYIYKEEEIVNALADCGFSLLCAEGIYGEEKTTTDRLCFLARKIR